MKDVRKTTRPVMMNMLKTNKVDEQKKRILGSMEDTKYTPEFIQAIKDYNSKVTTLNPKYTSPKMMSQIVCRVFLYEPNVLEGGTIEPVRTNFKVPTPNHQMINQTKESDYPYSLKAVVVNTPDGSYSVKQGDIVQLKNDAIQIGVIGDSKRGYTEIVQNAYRPVSNVFSEPSTDLTHEDYGYILVNYQDIIAVYGVE